MHRYFPRTKSATLLRPPPLLLTGRPILRHKIQPQTVAVYQRLSADSIFVARFSSHQPQSLLQRIQLPDTWRGRRAERKAVKLWEHEITQLVTHNAESWIAQRKGPLSLEIDGRLQKNVIVFSPSGIRFACEDPFGEQLLNIAEPTLWSKRSPWLRWPVAFCVGYLGILLLLFCFGRERVPIIGSSRYSFLPPGYWLWFLNKNRLETEALVQEIQGAIPPGDHPIVQRCQSVFNRLINASGQDHTKWSLHIINAPEIQNAVVSLSGHVLLFSGLFDIVQDDDELATVLGHEIGHVLAHHSRQEASANIMTKALVGPFMPFCIGIGGIGILGGSFTLLIVGGFFGIPIAAGVILDSFLSRKRESEADCIGLLVMAEADFNPLVAARFWEKMDEELAELQKQNPNSRVEVIPQYLQTHPHAARRMNQVAQWAPEVAHTTGKSSTSLRLSKEDARRLEASKRRWTDFLDNSHRRRVLDSSAWGAKEDREEPNS